MFPFPQQQDGREGCIPFHNQQDGREGCIPFNNKQDGRAGVYPFHNQQDGREGCIPFYNLWCGLSRITVSTVSSLDVQSVPKTPFHLCIVLVF